MDRFSLGSLTLIALVVLAVSGIEGEVRQDGSCVGKCELGLQPGASCQCNSACSDFGDCCSDYQDVCYSCEDRCGIDYYPQNDCQCNNQCPDFGNCCSDYFDVCNGGETPPPTPGTVTDQQLLDFGERMIALDLNNCQGLITTDYQGSISQCSSSDNAPSPMFSRFDDSIWSIPTIAALRELYDNYEPNVRDVEDHTSAEQAEEEAFLDAVFQTPVMTEAYNFLSENVIFTGSISDFRDKVREIWFTPYDRDGTSATVLGSSGFEHVFIGEIKDGDVSGFHSWIHYHVEEEAGNINYQGYIEQVDFSGSGEGITNVHTWLGAGKCIGGFFVGTSPELDLAVKTVCFLAREGSSCRLSYNGQVFNIVTYILSGTPYVGTAYPEF